MGAQPSKPQEAISDKALVQRLGNMHLNKDRAGESWSSPQNTTVSDEKRVIAHREPQGLSVQAVESWQREFLKVPKNR